MNDTTHLNNCPHCGHHWKAPEADGALWRCQKCGQAWLQLDASKVFDKETKQKLHWMDEADYIDPLVGE